MDPPLELITLHSKSDQTTNHCKSAGRLCSISDDHHLYLHHLVLSRVATNEVLLSSLSPCGEFGFSLRSNRRRIARLANVHRGFLTFFLACVENLRLVRRGKGPMSPPLLRCSTFEGTDSEIRINEVVSFMNFQHVPSKQWVTIATFYLKEEAKGWWNWLHTRMNPITRQSFTKSLLARFGPTAFEESFYAIDAPKAIQIPFENIRRQTLSVFLAW